MQASLNLDCVELGHVFGCLRRNRCMGGGWRAARDLLSRDLQFILGSHADARLGVRQGMQGMNR